MFATIATIILVVWLYRSTAGTGVNPWPVIGVGLVSFYAALQLWSVTIGRLIIGKNQVAQHSMGAALTVELSSIAVGVIVVVLIKRLFFKKKTQ